MWHVLIWCLVLILLAVWTALAWAAHALLTGPDWGGADPGAWLRWLENWRLPVWLADWLPMAAITELKAWLTTWGPWLEDLLHSVPSLLGWAAPLVWVAWGLGLLALLFTGVVGSVLVAALRPSRPSRPSSPTTPTPPLSAPPPGATDASRR